MYLLWGLLALRVVWNGIQILRGSASIMGEPVPLLYFLQHRDGALLAEAPRLREGSLGELLGLLEAALHDGVHAAD